MDANKLPITGPCPIDLDATGFDRKARIAHCSHCDKNVHNLSNMTKPEARAFLRENRGKKLCLSYARSPEGQIRFRQPAVSSNVVPIARLRRCAPPAAAALAGAALALAACTPHAPPPKPTPTITTEVEVHAAGGVSVPEIPPEPVPMPGQAVIPIDVVDGEVAIDDSIVEEGDVDIKDEVFAGEAPIQVDEPCDKAKATPRGGL